MAWDLPGWGQISARSVKILLPPPPPPPKKMIICKYYQLISSKIYQIVSGKTNLDLSNQSSGIYIVKILGTQPYFIKVVKQ